MELVFQQCMSLLNNTMPQPVSWTAGYSEQKMHPSTTKQWFKLSMNILRTLTSTQVPYDKAVLETSRQASARRYRESIVLPPLPATVDSVFQQSDSHVL
ncbi:hypothetical protein TNCT_403271 [Trichonephila clavata]|uniref:Uncharacterized protein n=1 Tax=Trichonephila clavata TaxID=2740835 RepID=A0A8X6HBM0_TRICU|nr:hypothetical protein TNCT_403271 [Trichonephila clavata]